jgi:FdrA protein
MCLLDAAGVGISHALGVGGRDLSAHVSGRSTLQALTALDADPATELILVVSKPPAPQVADLIHEAARRLTTPTLFALLGAGQDDLTAAVENALTALGVPIPEWPSLPFPQTPASGLLRGLFVGGTLCDEAMLIAAAALGPIRSNIPLRPEWALGPPGHSMIDFGDDEMTRGRAHPMIDPTLRLERLAAEAADPSTGVLLLDVVLGYGAEPDPSALLAPAIEAARADRDLPVVVSLCGTTADPQDRERQSSALQAAGAAVFFSNAAATRHAIALIQRGQS